MTGDRSPNATGGLILSNTDSIRSFLASASDDLRLPQDLRQTASDLLAQPSVPYKSLRSIWFATEPSSARPDLLCLLSGSNFVLNSPKPREKSEELKVRLRKLEELAERKAYAELVKDITPKKGIDEPFSSYKDQLGFVEEEAHEEVEKEAPKDETEIQVDSAFLTRSLPFLTCLQLLHLLLAGAMLESEHFNERFASADMSSTSSSVVGWCYVGVGGEFEGGSLRLLVQFLHVVQLFTLSAS